MSKGTIIVTGGTGYIGSHTIVDLISHGYKAVCIDSEINSDSKVLATVEKLTSTTIPFHNIDLCDYQNTKEIFQQYENIVGVIHFAALKAVGESVEDPIRYFKNNIDALLSTLEASISVGVKAFVFSSSCTVYGNVTKSPVSEETPWQEAESPYGRTKQIGEQILSDTLKNIKNINGILLRYFNPAGAHPSGLMGESPINKAQNLVPAITETAIGKREKLVVFGDDYNTRDGTCIRDYIHVCDLARAHTLALDYLLSGHQSCPVDIYNLGIGNGLTVLEVIHAFEKVSGTSLNYTIGPRREGDVVAIYSDLTKASKVLQWTPKYSVDDIMHTAWQWELNRQ